MFNAGPMDYGSLLQMLRGRLGGGTTPGMPDMGSATPIQNSPPMFDVTPPQIPTMPSSPQMSNPSPLSDAGPANLFSGSAGRTMPVGRGVVSGPIAGAGGRTPSPTTPNDSVGETSRGRSGGLSMRDRMSPNRPGFWGAYNRISQAFQPQAMRMLGI